MMTFKCKMCGGDLSFEPGARVAECPYCGTTQTLPKLDDDKRANLYDRANHFRRQNEYDKAMAIYEQILAEDRTDAEAYWSLVLCRYGIEYVEDPATHRRVPTVNRVQYASILADEDYKSALEYADAVQKGIYEAEASAIAEIQKGILDISKQEEPFDVFICYKETDNDGRRTPDSALANDLYYQLVSEGYKVFFSRITLEDKLGQEYEPYIFAALNSAKVMLVLGTKSEYFNAVWVKNEWKRFLSIMAEDRSRLLIPCYRDMDPYDLPDEFATLQCQDMSRIGFVQDIIHGIKKILVKQTDADETAIIESNDENNLSYLLCEELKRDIEQCNSDISKKRQMISELNKELDKNKGVFKKKNREAINERIIQTNNGVDLINIRRKTVEAFMYAVQHNPNNSKIWIDFIVGEVNKTKESNTNQNIPAQNLNKKEKSKQPEMSSKEFVLAILGIGLIVFMLWIMNR